MNVSIAVPTYNRAASLARLLASVPKETETVVVDDGSNDSTPRVVESFARPNLHYIRQINRGPAAARNAGARATNSAHIAFIDDDCVAVPVWPYPLVERLQALGPPYAAVGGVVRPLSKGVISEYMTFHRILEPPTSLAYFVTANCVVTRDAFEAAGGFDESIPFPGGEDPGLSQEIRRRGYKIGYASEAVVLHDYRESLSNFIRTFYRYGRGCAHVMAPRT